MRVYKITQKQGNRTITSTLEAKSYQHLMDFLSAVSTAKVTCVYEVLYENDKNLPIDDFNYFRQFKAFGSNGSNVAKQILIHNVKPNLSEDMIYDLIKTHLSVSGDDIKSINCRLFYK